MLPISPRAERAGLGVGLDAEHGAERPRVVVADDEQRRRVDLAGDRHDHAPDEVLGGAGGLDRLGQLEGRRAGHGELDRAAEQRRERRAGGAGADVRELAQGVELEVGVASVGHVLVRFLSGGAQRRCQGVGHEGVAVDEQGDLAVGEDGGAGHGGQIGQVRGAAGG